MIQQDIVSKESLLTNLPENVNIGIGLLNEDWSQKVKASEVWPKEISDEQVKKCFINLYRQQKNLPIMTCGVCALLVEDSQCHFWHLDSNNPSPIEKLLTDKNGKLYIDNCGIETTSTGTSYVRSCSNCWNSLKKKECPLVSIRNGFDYGCFSDMPNYLRNLTLVEERLISPFRTYGYITKIIKNHSSIGNYRKTKGHIIVVPQDIGPLYNILPSRHLQLAEVIKVLWVGKERPNHQQLGNSLQIRREVVRIALLGLKKYNTLYSDIEIDHNLLNGWPETFIPPEIVDSMVLVEDVEEDEAERSSYADEISLNPDSIEEYDIQNVDEEFFSTSGLSSIDQKNDLIGTSLVPVLLSFESVCAANKPEKPSLTSNAVNSQYAIQMQVGSTVVNEYTESRLFPGTFPTLFWNKQMGHLDMNLQRLKISYRTWFSSLLRHHTRRFAKHPTFMHVAFNLENRHRVNRAANIIVSREDWKKKSSAIYKLTSDELQQAVYELQNNIPVTIPSVFSLLSSCSAIGKYVPLSQENRMRMRANIKANIVRFGLPAIWLTINPSDLTHPMLCQIAGISLSPQLNLSKDQVQLLKSKTATTNPVASAQFFHHMIISFFNCLVIPQDGSEGVFGDIESYFSTTETNGRGSLHLHGFLWLKGNIGFENLREKVLKDEEG